MSGTGGANIDKQARKARGNVTKGTKVRSTRASFQSGIRQEVLMTGGESG